MLKEVDGPVAEDDPESRRQRREVGQHRQRERRRREPSELPHRRQVGEREGEEPSRVHHRREEDRATCHADRVDERPVRVSGPTALLQVPEEVDLVVLRGAEHCGGDEDRRDVQGYGEDPHQQEHHEHREERRDHRQQPGSTAPEHEEEGDEDDRRRQGEAVHQRRDEVVGDLLGQEPLADDADPAPGERPVAPGGHLPQSDELRARAPRRRPCGPDPSERRAACPPASACRPRRAAPAAAGGAARGPRRAPTRASPRGSSAPWPAAWRRSLRMAGRPFTEPIRGSRSRAEA